MEKWTTYNRNTYTGPEEITESLLQIIEAPQEIRNQLQDAIYHIQAAAQNKYNADYFRTLYNVLTAIAERR